MNNAANNANNTSTVTEILCRLDVAKNAPVVFFRGSIDGEMILAWCNGAEEVTSLAYYHTTKPLSAADEEVLRQRYATVTGDKAVRVHHRLPRVPRERMNLLAAPTPAPMPQAAPAPQPAPTPIQAVTAPLTQGMPAHDRRAPVKSGRKAGGSRRSAAKPIGDVPAGDHITQFAQAMHDAGAVPMAQAGTEAPSVSQATPGDVMAAIQALGEDFNNKLAALMATLAPRATETA